MRHASGKPRGAGRKVATNLSLDPSLVAEAKALGLNLSRLVEEALREAIRERRRQAWLEENRDAIVAHNARVDARGVFSDGRRRF